MVTFYLPGLGYDPTHPPPDPVHPEATVARDRHPKAQLMRSRLAAAAARIMAEDGIDDFALAKRKAARILGATDTHSMPRNEEIEAELRAYQSLYQGDEQRERLGLLRAAALRFMRQLARFRPYLTGAVLSGTAGRYAGIELQLFSDDSKGVEIFFIDAGLAVEGREQRLYRGDEMRVVPLIRLDWDGLPVSITVLDARDERSVLRATPGGRAIERASLAAVAALVDAPVESGSLLYNPAEV